ncbi:cyclic pyranopterin monophosphate synthase MoaC [Thermocrinis minervae]|uniref:cyclic pyranopterin monophosphate synthase n=1 Tax=Thermocrinis minervae TaxID=381751 RepID=A0A1M6PYY6_9AQUI|nr:cyclic pyranopterin monophosphate synthase MoaC [Thermocrinis minervae]SHK13076.1 cyclic pyranopterin phosphate synthase [Thermocrinis minervae]
MRTVDVSNKPPTLRIARAYGRIRLKTQTVQKIIQGQVPKGDVLSASKLAGIMASKHTHQLLPFCHPLSIDHVEVDLKINEDSIEVFSFVKGVARTGYEMEALTAVSVSLLCIYDMCKGLDDSMVIEEIKLLEKKGGKSDWRMESLNMFLDEELSEFSGIVESKGHKLSGEEKANVVITTKYVDLDERILPAETAVNLSLFSINPSTKGVIIGRKKGKLYIVLDKSAFLAFFENFSQLLPSWIQD